MNQKLAQIPCFKIKEVGYYINYDIKQFNNCVFLDKRELEDIIGRIE